MKYKDAEKLIKEGDVILFHAGGFLSLGWFITGITRGKYSHVGIASWNNGVLTLIEQKEFKGGREIVLSSQQHKKFDVYRVNPTVWKRTGQVEFDEEVAKCVTHTARSITGQPYGWSTIWHIYKKYIPFYRFFYRKATTDEDKVEWYVCSTLVSKSFRKCYTDLISNLSDEDTTPDDLARSPLLSKVLTVEE